MNIDPKQILAWCAVPAAVGGMLLYFGGQIDARAQDAAQAQVKKELAPVQQQLGELVDQGRRDEDFRLRVYCLDRKHQDKPADERERLCDAESDARWVEWRAKDEQAKEEEPDPQ